MTKSAEEALDDLLDASCPWLDGATREAIAVKLTKDGFTLIPTPDNPAFEGMVEKGALELWELPSFDDRRAQARAVLLAIMGEGTG